MAKKLLLSFVLLNIIKCYTIMTRSCFNWFDFEKEILVYLNERIFLNMLKNAYL